MSAKALNNRLEKIFTEKQIYRIDHYLAKDGVMALKPLTKPDQVKRITIRLLETMGVDGRGPFYETVGALRDVGQNHLLSIFTILTGQPADKLELIAAERTQYDGYRQVAGVAPDSEAETYFKITAKLKASPWRGTEIILESGKKRPAVKKEVVVEYQVGRQEIFPLELNREAQYVAEYEQLFLDAIMGEHQRFLTRGAVESAWRFVDPIIANWKNVIINSNV